MTLDEFFSGYEASRPLFDALRELVESVGPSELRVSKSQIAFARRRAFAWAWVPDRYLNGQQRRSCSRWPFGAEMFRRDGSKW